MRREIVPMDSPHLPAFACLNVQYFPISSISSIMASSASRRFTFKFLYTPKGPSLKIARKGRRSPIAARQAPPCIGGKGFGDGVGLGRGDGLGEGRGLGDGLGEGCGLGDGLGEGPSGSVGLGEGVGSSGCVVESGPSGLGVVTSGPSGSVVVDMSGPCVVVSFPGDKQAAFCDSLAETVS